VHAADTGFVARRFISSPPAIEWRSHLPDAADAFIDIPNNFVCPDQENHLFGAKRHGIGSVAHAVDVDEFSSERQGIGAC
jgi:hypothetical protein